LFFWRETGTRAQASVRSKIHQGRLLDKAPPIRRCGTFIFAELTLLQGCKLHTADAAWAGDNPIEPLTHPSCTDKRSARTKDPMSKLPFKDSQPSAALKSSRLVRMISYVRHLAKDDGVRTTALEDEPPGLIVFFSWQVTPADRRFMSRCIAERDAQPEQSAMAASVIPTIAICNVYLWQRRAAHVLELCP